MNHNQSLMISEDDVIILKTMMIKVGFNCFMLKVFNKLNDKEFAALMKVYIEGNEDNAAYFYPDKPLCEGVRLAEADFKRYLDCFFAKDGSRYFLLEENGEFISALRIRSFEDFYYLEALETAPIHRRKGYAVSLITQVCGYLAEETGKEIVIRDCVSKNNQASLAAHKKAGFVIETEQGIDYENGSKPDDHYGMILRRKCKS